MLKQGSIESVLRPYVEAGQLAGVAALSWRDGEIQDVATVGRRDLQTGLPVERDTLFRIASMTKLVTYPEEGHGVQRYPAAIDYAARVVAWFEQHM